MEITVFDFQFFGRRKVKINKVKNIGEASKNLIFIENFPGKDNIFFSTTVQTFEPI